VLPGAPDVRGKSAAEAKVMREDRPMQLPQWRRGPDTDFAVENLVQQTVGGKCLGLPSTPIERDHALRTQTLPQWIRTDQFVQLADREIVPAETE
jgi:hypothetical protein